MLRVTNHQRPPYQLGFIGPTHRRRADRILRVSGRLQTRHLGRAIQPDFPTDVCVYPQVCRTLLVTLISNGA